jgi:23S rRNA pseudouridine1911/1915/1917 synthase
MTDSRLSARLKIVFEDSALIAVDKPSGMLVIETPKREKNTLTHLLNEYLDSCGVEANAHPCHRIDRETSGLILYAKGKSVQRAMMDEFKNRRVKKAYVAFVDGKIPRPRGTIDGNLFNRNKARAERAITNYTTIEARPDFSVVEAEPVTGRTNQIRRQFADIGHPLLGERVFAFGRDHAVKFRRVALHARVLQFVHPVTGSKVSLRAELPADMKAFLEERGVRMRSS